MSSPDRREIARIHTGGVRRPQYRRNGRGPVPCRKSQISGELQLRI